MIGYRTDLRRPGFDVQHMLALQRDTASYGTGLGDGCRPSRSPVRCVLGPSAGHGTRECCSAVMRLGARVVAPARTVAQIGILYM